MRRILVRALQNAGYDVASFDNGRSAYHRLREDRSNCMLTDIVMPEMDGIELARAGHGTRSGYQGPFHHRLCCRGAEPEIERTEGARVLSKPFHLKDQVNEVNGGCWRPDSFSRARADERALPFVPTLTIRALPNSTRRLSASRSGA